MGPVKQAILSNLICVPSKHETVHYFFQRFSLLIWHPMPKGAGHSTMHWQNFSSWVLRSNPNLPNRTRLHRDMQKLMELSGSKTVPYLGGLGLSEMWGHRSWVLLDLSVVPSRIPNITREQEANWCCDACKIVKRPCRFASLSMGFHEPYEAW